MEEKTLKDMIGPESKSNYNIEDILEDIQSDDKFNIKPSEIQYGSRTEIGGYEVVMYRDYVFVYNSEKVIAIMSVYEMYDFAVMPEKELVIVYGHEQIVLFFLDGTMKSIWTR